MDALVNRWEASDWANVRDAFIGQGGYLHRQVIFRQFAGYGISGDSVDLDNMFRIPAYVNRAEHVWLSQVKVYDTVKGGYFTTGDLDVASSFIIRGYTGSYNLPGGMLVPEYAGDQIIWNGKIWIVADQLDPVQAGTYGPVIFYRTTMRRGDRAGLEQTVDAGVSMKNLISALAPILQAGGLSVYSLSGVQDGINTTFVLSIRPDPNKLLVIKNGLTLSSPGDYSISGMAAVFTVAPDPEDQIFALY